LCNHPGQQGITADIHRHANWKISGLSCPVCSLGIPGVLRHLPILSYWNRLSHHPLFLSRVSPVSARAYDLSI
jgi:hypothetical protein